MTPDVQARLDRYLDGQLSAEEVAAFDADIMANAELAEAVRLQRAIDGSLARLFEYGPAEAAAEVPAPEPIPFTHSKVPTHRRFSWRWAAWGSAVAALLAIAVYVNRPVKEFTFIAPQTMYKRLLVTGWNPPFTCTTDQEFIDTVRARLGHGLLIPIGAAGITLDGWAYGDTYQGSPVSADTLVLMAHAAEKEGGTKEPVLLFIDKTSNARKVEVPEESGLRVFEARRGKLVLYEVTPLSRPVLIEAAVAE